MSPPDEMEGDDMLAGLLAVGVLVLLSWGAYRVVKAFRNHRPGNEITKEDDESLVVGQEEDENRDLGAEAGTETREKMDWDERLRRHNEGYRFCKVCKLCFHAKEMRKCKYWHCTNYFCSSHWNPYEGTDYCSKECWNGEYREKEKELSPYALRDRGQRRCDKCGKHLDVSDAHHCKGCHNDFCPSCWDPMLFRSGKPSNFHSKYCFDHSGPPNY
jgi:hypothetical protein